MASDRAVSVFCSIDKDFDGKITLDELLIYMLEEGMDIDDCSSLFSRMDKNKDGFLSSEEFSSGMNMFSSEGGDVKTGEEWDGSHLVKPEAPNEGTGSEITTTSSRRCVLFYMFFRVPPTLSLII